MSFGLVKEFNAVFGVVTRNEPAIRVPEAKLRFSLIEEEFDELLTAYKECDLVEFADALGDIDYVVIGAAQVFGIDRQVESEYYSILDDYELDGANPILLQEGHDLILEDLRESILKADAPRLVEILAGILALTTLTARIFNVPLKNIISAIHDSNMTKLDEDGTVIRRESDNKVLKGPNYKTPTDDINKILFGEHYAPIGD